jgi:ubiquinone/menaquinone biosynthesis C-methylase UbiE
VQSTEPEWMDTPGHAREVVVDNLKDLRRCNLILGGLRLTRVPLARLARRLAPGETLRVLDVATGGGDIPRDIARWARSVRRPLVLVASDISEQLVALAREQSAELLRRPAPPPAEGAPVTLLFVVADARRLPFARQAFHVTTCSLALHHMLQHEARQMLTEMGRCASVGVVVNDIVRGWLGYVGAYVATRLGSRNALTWHDGPLSVLRAYTTEEMHRLAEASGLRPVRWDSFLFYRVAMTAVPQVPGSGFRVPSRPPTRD